MVSGLHTTMVQVLNISKSMVSGLHPVTYFSRKFLSLASRIRVSVLNIEMGLIRRELYNESMIKVGILKCVLPYVCRLSTPPLRLRLDYDYSITVSVHINSTTGIKWLLYSCCYDNRLTKIASVYSMFHTLGLFETEVLLSSVLIVFALYTLNFETFDDYSNFSSTRYNVP